MANEQNGAAAKGMAVITGASAGIGAVYADRLAKRGHDLLLVARRGDRLQALAEKLKAAYGVKVETLVADLAAPADLDKLADRLAGDPGITVLVNNAGTATLAPATKIGPEAQDAMIALNVTALTRLSGAVLPTFLEKNRGVLVNVGSILSFHTLPGSSVYSGTKGFVMNYTRGLQLETEGTDVVVQLLMPGAIATDIWEVAGIGGVKALDPAIVMTTENLVDAALAGLDGGEKFTLPSLENAGQWENYDNARAALFKATGTGKPASRYGLSH